MGNAAHVVVVDRFARRMGAELVLRIDDMDRDRYRREYVDDILAVLDWLGIAPDEGPSSTAEFERHFSLQMNQAAYRQALDRLLTDGRVETYACACSRQSLARGHRCDCRGRGAALVPFGSALRVHVPESLSFDLASAMGDFVIWRRDDLASYHLASVVEDDRLGITHIVRGADLEASTAAQRFIAPALGATTFGRATVLHHPLVTDATGAKLSKSTLRAGPLERTPARREEIMRVADAIEQALLADGSA